MSLTDLLVQFPLIPQPVLRNAHRFLSEVHDAALLVFLAEAHRITAALYEGSGSPAQAKQFRALSALINDRAAQLVEREHVRCTRRIRRRRLLEAAFQEASPDA